MADRPTGGADREVFPPGSSAPASARAYVATEMERLGRGDLADEAGLVVGELASNAVLHGAGDLAVEVLPRAGGVRIAVSDAGRARPRVREAADGHPTGQGGLGLVIVERLSRAWGVDEDPSGGKTVWAELD